MLIRKILVALVMIAMLGSCKKVLDIEPEYELDGSQRFNNLDDYEFALVGVYRLFQSTSYYGSTDGRSNAFVGLPDMLTDNVNETAESLGNERVFSRWAYSEDEDQIERTWLAAYRIISQANLVLKGIDNFSGEDAGRVNRIKGQALAIRALVHFDVLRYWVDDYDRNSGDPGIPYITTYDYEQKPARGTVKQSYDAIEADLKTARVLLSNTDRDVNEGDTRAYMDVHGANAVLARMYLYSNQMDSAIKYSTLVINEFPLADWDEFQDIWKDASNAEVVWALVFDAGQGEPASNIYFPSTDRSSYRPNQTLVASYDPVNDTRFESYFQVISGRRVLSKYLAKEAQTSNPDGTTNFKALRVAEMYLIRAEAYARSGNDAAGVADLNELRSARIIGYIPVALAGQALLDAIAFERRKELIAEGHRWFDLKRTTRTVNRANCTSFCTLDANSRSWTWPIPQPEIDANPNILPQNPGY